MEDAKDYDWGQVRDWSEEVMGKIADNIITWEDTNDIRGLRGNTSQFQTGRLFDTNPSQEAEEPTYDRPQYQTLLHVPRC